MMTPRIGRSSRFSRGAILVLLAAASASCTLLPAPKATARTTFLLGPETPFAGAAPAQCAARTATLLVNVPREEPGYDTQRMVYLRRPHALNYFANSQWADTPARMLAPMIVKAVEETGCWHAVVRMPGVARGDYRLDTEDLVLEQDFFSRPSKVRVAIRAILVDVRDQSVVAARRFEASEEAPTEDAEGGAIAANRAALKLLDSLAAWVNESVPREGSGR